LLDGYQPGELAPMQRAERDLARARLITRDTGPDAANAALAAATRAELTLSGKNL
jgi:hypothetical protein